MRSNMKKILSILSALIVILCGMVTVFAGGTVTDPENIVAPQELFSVAAIWYDYLRFRLAPLIIALVLAWSGFRILGPVFFGSNDIDASRVYSSVLKTFGYSILGFMVVLFLPAVINGVKSILVQYAWKP